MRVLRALARAGSACAIAVVLAAAAASGPTQAATSGTTVGATVLSAVSISAVGCPTGDATRTSFGSLAVGTSAVTSADCDIQFGSSNDTATLRAYQADGHGSAMGTGTGLTGVGSGVRMLDVDMANASVGWAVSEGGASSRMYKTTDGGATWVAVADANDGLNAPAEGVDAVSPTVAWASRQNGNEVARTVDGSNWTTLTLSAFPTAAINKIVAWDASTAWVTGSELVGGRARARVWKTTDGGTNWALVWTDNTVDSEGFEGVALSATNVYIATTANGTGSGVIHATDGTNFAATGGFSSAYDVDSYDGTHVAAALGVGKVAVSADAGATWTQKVLPVEQSARAIDYDASGVIVTGTVGGYLERSTNDGATWSLLDQDRTHGRVYAIDAVGPSLVLAAYHANSIVRSTDGGATWSLNAQATVTNWLGVDGTDGGRTWRVGPGGALQASVDGGATWSNQTSSTTNLLSDIAAQGRTRAVAVGAHGTIVRTTDGTTWTTVTSPTTATLRSIAVAGADGTLLAGGDNGTLIRSSDGGATWSVVTSAPSTPSPFTAVAAWDANRMIVAAAGGTNRVWTSNDGGATWTVRGTGSSDGVNALDVVPGTGIAYEADGGYVRRSSNYGATWATAAPSSQTIIDLDVSPDGTSVWAVGDYALQSESVDGGVTWQTYLGGSTTRIAESVVAFAPGVAVAVYDGGYAKYATETTLVPDYDGAAASWAGTGFFGACLRAAPSTTAGWPTTGSCPASDGTNWRAIPANGGLAAATVANTTAPGTTTASFRFGIKVPSSQAAAAYRSTLVFEAVAPAG